MATITYTRAKVYSDTTGTTQVGQTIEVQGSPSTIAMNYSTLGVNLSPGSQYSVSVQCTNDEDYTTAWTDPYPYKTLILADLTDFQGGVGKVSPSISCSYTSGVLSVADVGVYLSTNASGAGAVKYSGHNEQDVRQGYDITGLTENTTYYAVPYVVDNLGREYIGDWANADSANTGYTAPTVTISNVAITYNSISGNVLVTTNDTLTSVKLSIIPTGGGGSYQYKTLSATAGIQAWSITNGDLDDSSSPITINPSTEYGITIEAIDTHGVSSNAQTTVTTAAITPGTISLTYVSTTRSGNNYIASYTYTSTYALSSAIMSINSTNVQGLIAGNNITFTISGLTHGDSYLCIITATDIYTETGTLSGSITTTVVNEVTITSTVAAETSMRLNLSYTTDSGFRSGYGECWAIGDDADTDQPESYAFFNEGDTYVVVPNINADTRYQFRAIIELDNSTEVCSSVVVARTTTHDYSQDYFTIKNESNSSNTITLNAQNYGLYSNAHFYVSEDDGSTWTDKEINSTRVNLATIGSGRKLLIKHYGYISIATQNIGTLYSIISCSADYSVSGNVASLIYGDNFTSKPQTSFGIGYERLFYNDTHLVYAGNLVLTEDNNSTGEDFHSMFYGCTSLTTPPDTSRLTSLSKQCFCAAFCDCTSLTTAPDLSNVTTVGNSGMNEMFRNCTSLTTAPDLSNITSLSKSCMSHMFAGCIALTAMPKLNATTLAPNCYQNMFEECVSLTQTTNLPATTIERSSYLMMFQKCTSLTTGVDLLGVSVVNADGIYYMYNGCTSLTTAYAPAITWDTDKSKNWLQNVGASGTLYASWSIIDTIPSGDSSGSPSGWTKTGV